MPTARQRAQAAHQQHQQASAQMAQRNPLEFMFGTTSAKKADIAQQNQLEQDSALFAQGLEQQALQRQADMPGQIAALQAAGIDTRQIPGLDQALERGGGNVAAGLLANPASPLMQGRQGAEQQVMEAANRKLALDESKQALAVQKAQQDQLARYKPLQQLGRGLENVRTMKNLLADEGRLLGPSPERGAYNALRGQLLNTIRLQFEAGALQQAEMEFFKTLLPDAEKFTTTSQGERMAMLNEMEYQLTTSLTDDIATSGFSDIGVDNFAGPGRTVSELITGGIPQGFEAGTGDQVTRNPANRAADEAIIPPGTALF